MKFYVISDNVDTSTGMRLAGMEGTVVHTKEEVEDALMACCENAEIGIVLITDMLTKLCPELITKLKLTRKQPIIVGIPDRHGAGKLGDTLAQYIKGAIGINIEA